MFEFSEKQQAFLDDSARIRIMGGSAIGTGKTFVGYYEALRLSREIPNNYGVIFCENPKHERMRFEMMMQLHEGDTSTYSDRIVIHLPEGKESTIAFMDNCANALRLFPDRKFFQCHPLQSMLLGFVMFEEIETLTLKDIESIFQRLRREGDGNRRMWGTAADKPDWLETEMLDIGITVFNRDMEAS